MQNNYKATYYSFIAIKRLQKQHNRETNREIVNNIFYTQKWQQHRKADKGFGNIFYTNGPQKSFSSLAIYTKLTTGIPVSTNKLLTDVHISAELLVTFKAAH